MVTTMYKNVGNRIYNKMFDRIGSPQADWLHKRRAITWVSNYRCLIELFATGYL